MSRYFLKKVIIKGNEILPNQNPYQYIDQTLDRVIVRFDKEQKTITIEPSPNGIKFFRNESLRPSDTNANIGFACLVCIHNNKSEFAKFKFGPYIKRSNNLSTFPGKKSFVGGMFEENDDFLKSTAIRELREELDLDSYLPAHFIDTLYDKAEPSHMFFSHPSVNNQRRFNIIMVYTICLTKQELRVFNTNKYQKS